MCIHIWEKIYVQLNQITYAKQNTYVYQGKKNA